MQNFFKLTLFVPLELVQFYKSIIRDVFGSPGNKGSFQPITSYSTNKYPEALKPNLSSWQMYNGSEFKIFMKCLLKTELFVCTVLLKVK